MGRTDPERWRVMFGCVREKGDAVTWAISIGSEEVSLVADEAGSEIVKSRGGEVNWIFDGAGSMRVASASKLRVEDDE